MKGKITIILFALISASIYHVKAQDVKRFSINPEGGITLGHMSVETGINEFYGGSLELALAESFSLRGNFHAGTFADEDDAYNREFENSFFQYGLNANLYLMKPLGFRSNWFNPYLTGGIGRIHSDVEVSHDESPTWEGVNYENEDFFYNAGGGMKFKLGNTIDLFLQYHFNFTNTDFLDGYNEPVHASRFNDHYSTVTAGLSFKIGSGDEHIAWYDDSEETEREISGLRSDLRSVEEKIDEKDDEKLQELREEFAQFREEMKREMDEMERTPDTIVSQVEGRASDRDRDSDRDRERTAPESGKLYIIGGSFGNRDNAERLKNEYIDQGFDSVIYEDDDAGLYRVAIEEHENENQARERLNQIRQDVQNSAWLLIP